MNKRQSQIYRAYENSCDYSLRNCYAFYSEEKEKAWNECAKLSLKYKATSLLKIVSHNRYIFTAGFRFKDPETGLVKFMYISSTGKSPNRRLYYESWEI